jgi:hypothetical protein
MGKRKISEFKVINNDKARHVSFSVNLIELLTLQIDERNVLIMKNLVIYGY